jgi:hypothetical protein
LRPRRELIPTIFRHLLDTISTITLLVVEGRVFGTRVHDGLAAEACLWLSRLARRDDAMMSIGIVTLMQVIYLFPWLFLHKGHDRAMPVPKGFVVFFHYVCEVVRKSEREMERVNKLTSIVILDDLIHQLRLDVAQCTEESLQILSDN